MQSHFLSVHNIVRWLILLFALITLIRSLTKMGSGKAFTRGDKMSALFLLIFCDIQLLLGIYLYIANDWWTKLGNLKDIMPNTYLRFFTIEHNVAMIIAIILVHIGYSATKKNISDNAKFKRLFWFVLVAMIIILASIPWPFRAEVGRPWYPTHF